MKDFLTTLRTAMILIHNDEGRDASLLLTNWYHQEVRTQQDYRNILTLTKHHKEYVEADEHTKSEIARIFYGAERRFRHLNDSIYVRYDEKTKFYSIEEASSRA